MRRNIRKPRPRPFLHMVAEPWDEESTWTVWSGRSRSLRAWASNGLRSSMTGVADTRISRSR